jgi:uracil-DNA glycosylase
MKALLSRLCSFRSPNVFNPWGEDDPMDAAAGGAEARVERLRAHFDSWPRLILLGEAPGYQGCHFSGMAFTNERLILDGRIPRVSSAMRLTTRPRPWCEPSATIVWGSLHDLGLAERTVLWNAFAWHPHKPGNKLSNRTPAPKEVEEGLPVLRSLLEYFSGVPVIPVGQVAARTLSRLGIEALPPVRHPAMGGATAFREGMQAFASKRGRS